MKNPLWANLYRLDETSGSIGALRLLAQEPDAREWAREIETQNTWGKGMTPLMSCVSRQELDAVAILAPISDPVGGAENRSILAFAAEINAHKALAILVPFFDCAARDPVSGLTALEVSARLGHVKCAEALLPFSDVNSACPGTGMTPLGLALRGGKGSMAALLAPVSDWSAKTTNGDTLLMLAAMGSDAKTTRALIQKSDLRAKNNAGETALIIAAFSGNVEVLEALVPGSDLSVAVGPSGQRQTAFDIVAERDWHTCADVLAREDDAPASLERVARIARNGRQPARRIEAILEAEAIRQSIRAGAPSAPAPTRDQQENHRRARKPL